MTQPAGESQFWAPGSCCGPHTVPPEKSFLWKIAPAFLTNMLRIGAHEASGIGVRGDARRRCASHGKADTLHGHLQDVSPGCLTYVVTGFCEDPGGNLCLHGFPSLPGALGDPVSFLTNTAGA